MNKTDGKIYFKARVQSILNISDMIKLHPITVPFAFKLSKSVSCPSDIKYHFQY